MKAVWPLIFSLSLLSAAFALAASPVSTLHEKKTEWNNPRCEETGTCDLKRFTLTQAEYRVKINKNETTFGTRMISEYETEGVASLERYGLAQFIRGCQFSSERQPNGSVLKVRDIFREFNGTTIPYHHPKWVLDRVSPDPLDWGFEENSPIRHFYYWNSLPGSNDRGARNYYGYEKPSQPILYVRDLPGAAFFQEGSAKNLSLQFRVCIYKAADVPLEVAVDKLDFAKPLACLDWASSWIFNHEKGEFEQPLEMDNFCQ